LTNQTQTAQADANPVTTFALLRFYLRDNNAEQRALIPTVIPANIRGPRMMPPSMKHGQVLRSMGFDELAKIGRKRPGKVDSGEQIELDGYHHFTTRHFLTSMKEHGLKVVSLQRKVEPNQPNKGKNARGTHTRHVITLGIGWGDDVAMSEQVQDAINAIMACTWSQCFVWNNEAPRKAGVPTIDTINLTGLLPGQSPDNELMLDADANLRILPVGDVQLTLRTPRDQLPQIVTGDQSA
jgi:hypothetical protein